jgi:hypothetical protein
MLTHGAFEDPELIKCSQWLDQFRTEYQRVIDNDLWYDSTIVRAHQHAAGARRIKGGLMPKVLVAHAED